MTDVEEYKAILLKAVEEVTVVSRPFETILSHLTTTARRLYNEAAQDIGQCTRCGSLSPKAALADGHCGRCLSLIFAEKGVKVADL